MSYKAVLGWWGGGGGVPALLRLSPSVSPALGMDVPLRLPNGCLMEEQSQSHA